MQIILDSQNKSVVRIEKGEEFLSVLKSVAQKKDLSCNFSMIGACREVELSYFDVATKKYFKKVFTLENIIREYAVRDFGVRPVHQGLLHTAYLVFARK